MASALLRYGFQQFYLDHSLFIYQTGVTFLALLIYVDDLVLTGNNLEQCHSFKAYSLYCFKPKDLGILKYFLGIEVVRSQEGLFMCQCKYALHILTEIGMLGAKPASFPMEQNHKLTHNGGELLVDASRYRRLIGRLLYLTIIRPDIVYPVHILTPFMQNPC